eukprot:jgi/Galph1/3423/GphlegSOOS_G2076.1
MEQYLVGTFLLSAYITSFLKWTSNKSRIKSQLVRILPFFINLPVQRRKIHSLIQALEAQYTPPSDWDKLVASLEGNWTLGFSSTTLGVPSGSLMVNKVMQEITRRNDSKDGLKELNMLNICHWKYREMDCFGRFEIYCRLTLLSRNRMICQVLEYTLIPEGQVKLKEPQALVRQLQRSLPREFFDPRDALVETTYVDEDMKIVKWMGKKFAGVRNIFYSLELSNPDCSTTSHG